MVQSLLASLGFWSWFIIGALLLMMELVTPGVFFVWLGLAALATGLIAVLADPGWQVEVLLFAGLAIVFVLIGVAVTRRSRGAETDQPMLNRRAERQIGRSFVLSEPIVAGIGRVRIDDSVWRLAGPDTPAGSRVRVTGLDGATLLVEPEAP